MDKLTKNDRSILMSKIKPKGARSTEAKFRASLVSHGLRGWKMNPKGVAGKPDFVFAEHKVAIFIDGCFWHGCPQCCRMPSSHKDYWRDKIAGNKLRDKKSSRALKKEGWTVIRFWEHQLKISVKGCTQKIKILIS